MRHTPWFRLQKGQEMVRLEYISILKETIPFLLRVGTQNMSIIATRGLEKVPIQEIIKCDFGYEPR